MAKYIFKGFASQKITIEGKTTNLLPGNSYDLPSDLQKVKTLISVGKLEEISAPKSSSAKNYKAEKAEEKKTENLEN